MSYPTHCPECDNKVVLKAQAGRTMSYKSMSDLALPDDLEIPTCTNCNEKFFDATLASIVDGLLVVEYYKATIDQLDAQLPEGMKDCTILSKACEIGHHWLTATNWIEFDCPTCELNKVKDTLANLSSCRICKTHPSLCSAHQPLTGQIKALRRKLDGALEWQTSVHDIIKLVIPEYKNLDWGGSKEGWGFIFELIKYIQKDRDKAKAIIAVIDDGECSEGCDSIAHDDDCPVANPIAGLVQKLNSKQEKAEKVFLKFLETREELEQTLKKLSDAGLENKNLNSMQDITQKQSVKYRARIAELHSQLNHGNSHNMTDDEVSIMIDEVEAEAKVLKQQGELLTYYVTAHTNWNFTLAMLTDARATIERLEALVPHDAGCEDHNKCERIDSDACTRPQRLKKAKLGKEKNGA